MVTGKWIALAAILTLAALPYSLHAAAPAMSLIDNADRISSVATACEMGNKQACATFNDILAGIGETELKQHYLDYIKACDAGKAEVCWALGTMHLDGLVMGRRTSGDQSTVQKMREDDKWNARMLFRRACNAGYPKACRDLGHLYEFTPGEKPDVGLALHFFIKACDAGSAQGCENWGDLLEYGVEGVDQDEAKSRALWSQACDGGDPLACSKLAWKIESGHFTLGTADYAMQLRRTACDGGISDGCRVVAAHYDQGDILPKNDALAVAYYTKACELEDYVACTFLGNKYQKGEGVARDSARAVALFLKSCQSFIPACQSAAFAYLHGDGVTKDYALAYKFYDYGCHSGDRESCLALAKMRASGQMPSVPGGEAAYLINGPMDYPAEALRDHEMGTTFAHFTIDKLGHAQNCTASGATPILNAHACDTIIHRFFYMPARDSNGNPIEQSETKRINWINPK